MNKNDALVSKLRIGCAGWTLPAATHASFPLEGSHLSRYAARFNAVEVNSCFHRSHKPATWARWAASVPDDFAFSVKLPKAITHELRLVECNGALDAFARDTSALGDKRKCVLVQLPPSLAFDVEVALMFFAQLRQRFTDTIVLEARHLSWFAEEATSCLEEFGVSRVHADPPAVVESPATPIGCEYFRLHGSPRMYYSGYTAAALERFAALLEAAREGGRDVWCIFDNTAAGQAIPDALTLQTLLQATQSRGP